MKRGYWLTAPVLGILGATILFARWWVAPDVPGRSRLAKANPVTQAPAEAKPITVRLMAELSAPNAIAAVIEPANRMQSTGALEAAVQSAQDDRTKKQEPLAVSHREPRAEEWVRENLIAGRDLEQAHVQADLARAQLRLAQARVAQQEAMLAQGRALESRAQIVVPIAGWWSTAGLRSVQRLLKLQRF